MTHRRPRLAAVLLAVNLLIFLLPLGGIAILRLYESELIRRTETELIVQGAFVTSIYRAELLRRLAETQSESNGGPGLSTYGSALPEGRMRSTNPDEPWNPVEATLDVAKDHIYPPAPDAVQSGASADTVAQLAAEYVTPVLLSAHKVTLTGIRVIDHQGIVVASTRGDVGKSLAGREEVARALRGEHTSVLRHRIPEGPTPSLESISRGNRVRVFVAMPVVEDHRVLGAVLLSRTPLDLSKALYQNRIYLLGGGAVILLVVCVVTIMTTLLVTRPVKALMHQAEQITRGEKSSVTVPLKRPGTREVALLSQALADMSATLEKRGDYIRMFASNVSHEFKTPLTSIRGTVELLKDHFVDMSEEDRSRFLKILEQDTDRLAKLVQRLLDLARAEVVLPGAEKAAVGEVFDRVNRRFRSEGVSMTFDASPEMPPVVMGPVVLESILSNLVDNARQHGGPNVHIHLSARQEKHEGADFAEITVQDDGPGVTTANLSRIFTPFFTTAKQSGGTGLGLSIVRALVIAHQGTIALEESLSGARFRISLPMDSGHPDRRQNS